MQKFRAGIIGCGNIFPMHAASIQLTDIAQVVAVSDVLEERAKQAASKYNGFTYKSNIKSNITSRLPKGGLLVG